MEEDEAEEEQWWEEVEEDPAFEESSETECKSFMSLKCFRLELVMYCCASPESDSLCSSLPCTSWSWRVEN